MQSVFLIELKAELADLEKADQMIAEFAHSKLWPEETLYQIRLVLEEIMINVISHGSIGPDIPQISFRLEQENGIITMEISDNGKAYDPLSAPLPDLDSDLDDRPIGGLGVYLVRQLMDHVSYCRDAGWNKLTLTKAII
jgi:serine/threonine-protein kinase RsbW/sigma-B regulation protein RsbU (phosphoserine phosphatase)